MTAGIEHYVNCITIRPENLGFDSQMKITEYWNKFKRGKAPLCIKE